jgi:hypothetical protein
MSDGHDNDFESRTWLLIPTMMLPGLTDPGAFSVPGEVVMVPLAVALTASGYLLSTPRMSDSNRRRNLLRIVVVVVVVSAGAVTADVALGHRFDAIWFGCLGAIMAWVIYPSAGTLRRAEKERTRRYSPYGFWIVLLCMVIVLGILARHTLSGLQDPRLPIALGVATLVLAWDERRRKRAQSSSS